MIKIIVDDELRDKLKGFTEPLDLCDESGRIVGKLIPVCDQPEYRPVRPPANDKDIRSD
jgi:hypothetical protein